MQILVVSLNRVLLHLANDAKKRCTELIKLLEIASTYRFYNQLIIHLQKVERISLIPLDIDFEAVRQNPTILSPCIIEKQFLTIKFLFKFYGRIQFSSASFLSDSRRKNNKNYRN